MPVVIIIAKITCSNSSQTKFLRAGIGDTLAKHYEVEFSARGRKLDYSSELGLTISSMCNEPLMRYA